jgi:integrase
LPWHYYQGFQDASTAFFMADTPHSPSPTLIEDVRRVLRLHHYSIHTERAYVEWIVRFVQFHRMQSRADLGPAEAKLEAFLTNLAIQGNVAAAPQNQAMHALVFLYKRVLHHPLEDRINAVRADKKVNVPVVMTRDEVATVLSLMEGTPPRVAKLLYGSGLRSMEAVRLRVKDMDFAMKQLTVRSGKGDKDRFTTFPRRSSRSSRTTSPGSQPYISRILHMAMGPSTFLMRSNGNIGWQRRNGAGSTSSPLATWPLTPARESPGAIMWTPASSTRRLRWRCAVQG